MRGFTRNKWLFCILMLIFVTVFSSCADFGDQKYQTWIDFPQQGALFELGDAVSITGHYYAEDQIEKVVLSVDGQSVKDLDSPGDEKPVGKITYDWVPDQAGDYLISLSIFSQEEVLLSDAQVEVIVLEELEVFEGVFNENGFCRLGPSTAYPAIAVFEMGYLVTLEGRSESLTPLWWFVSDNSGEISCWASNSVLETDINPESLMAMEAPPAPEPGSGEGTGQEACHQDMDAVQCIASGGTWYTPIQILTDPYCICPE